MQVAVEKLTGLKRKLTISIPKETVQQHVDTRLKKIARSARISGFRPGKAPMKQVEKHYFENIRGEVANDLVRDTLFDAIQAEKLNVAGMPQVDLGLIEANTAFSYDAIVELFPEIDLKDLQGQLVTLLKSEVTEGDFESFLEKLRKEHMTWRSVERPAAMDDKVTMDFEGSIDGVLFEGGKASNAELILGSGRMIPGFEAGVVGAEIGKMVEVSVTFPADYHSEELQGKAAVFKITLHTIQEGSLPLLDDAFAKQFDEPDLETLKTNMRKNMRVHLERVLREKNHEAVFKAFRATNDIELPDGLVNEEIKRLAQKALQRVFGDKVDLKKYPELPRSLFEKEAMSNVQLGLLFSAFREAHQLKADAALVEEKLLQYAEMYENAEAWMSEVRQNASTMEQIESAVLEDMLVAKLLESAQVTEKKVDFDTAVNQSEQDDQNEEGA